MLIYLDIAAVLLALLACVCVSQVIVVLLGLDHD